MLFLKDSIHSEFLVDFKELRFDLVKKEFEQAKDILCNLRNYKDAVLMDVAFVSAGSLLPRILYKIYDDELPGKDSIVQYMNEGLRKDSLRETKPVYYAASRYIHMRVPPNEFSARFVVSYCERVFKQLDKK